VPPFRRQVAADNSRCSSCLQRLANLRAEDEILKKSGWLKAKPIFYS